LTKNKKRKGGKGKYEKEKKKGNSLSHVQRKGEKEGQNITVQRVLCAKKTEGGGEKKGRGASGRGKRGLTTFLNKKRGRGARRCTAN